MMDEKTNMRYVDTRTASVKMTSGVHFTGSPMSDSSMEDEYEKSVEHRRQGSDIHFVDRGKSSSIEDLVTTNRKEHITSHLQQQNISEEQIKEGSPQAKRLSENLESMRFLSKDIKLDHHQSNSYVTYPDNLSSSTQKWIVSTDNNNINGTSEHALNSRQSIPHRSDVVDSSSITNNTNIKYTDSIDPDTSDKVSKMRSRNSQVKGKTQFKTEKSSLNNSFKFIATKSSTSREHSDSLRLSQSLENSQDSILKQWENGIVASNSMSAIVNTGNKGDGIPARANPFNNGLDIDEDHFSDSYDNYFRTDRLSTTSTKSSSVSQGVDWWQETSDISFAELGLSEDHFSHPQGHFGLSRAEELELAIENCKDLIREAVPESDKQKNLVLKLVQLRIKLQEVKEGPEPVANNVKIILSHKMMLKSSRTSKYYCERCNGAIWGMLQVWYRCTECGYRCHEKCLQQILRTCAKAKVLENPVLITEICPKEANGLAAQSYRCWECRLAVSYKNGHSEPRLCDYTGRYYCEFCHWNDTFIIPARVLHSWDFTVSKVCRASKQFLKLMQKKAVIRIQDVNPMLFVYVEQLNEIKKLREEMMIMKKYILSCVAAMSAKLLLLLKNRQHFVESSDRYSMQDLLDAENVLLPELVSVHSSWVQHIKVDCELCQGRGFCCELCDDQEILFPFDSTAVVCAKCATVLHRHCFANAGICPRCERRERRKSILS